MEDPWGSPWAADAPAKIELPAAPQNAHFSADSLFPRRSSRSPAPSRSPGFEDDDAWGGWNGGGAADGSASGKESPGWGRSPGLMPLQMAAPSVRSLSPDPWKEVALQRLDTTALEKAETQSSRARRASETSGDGRVVDSAISLGEGHQLQREDHLKSGIPAAVPSLDAHVAEDGWGVEVAPEAPAPDGIPAIQLEEPDSSPSVEIPVLEVKREEHKEPDKADETLRNEKEETIIIPNGVDTKEEEEPIAAVQAVDDAAVVPEPESDQLPPPIQKETVTEPQHQPQESPDEIFESPAESETKEVKPPSTTLQSQPAEQEQDTPWVLKDPSISYPVDLTKLDDLFPSTPAITVEAELVPDVIIDDTFASNSERKAWYRVSRFGSKRKHDLGDDDNYVRVGWSGSQIRDRTTQTVRRWMEEDSITGRVVLGRRLGGSGAVMFNWNSTAPVEIGEILGRHSRNSSMTVRSPAPSPTASSFGWASSVPTSPAIARHPLASEFQSPDGREAQSPKELKEPKVDSARHSLAIEPPPPPPPHTRGHIPTPIKIPPTLPISQDEDGDDDWGEMMTATPIDSPSFTEDEGGFSSNRNSVDPQSAFRFDQFETVFDGSKTASPRMEKASKRPLSWHLGQTLAKPFKRGSKTPSTPLFPSPLSKPMTPPQATPTRHAHTMSAGASPMQYSPARLSLSAEDEETVARLLRDIPDLTYMLR